MHFSKSKWTPFAGMKVSGCVRRVTLRGEVVFVDGQILAKPGNGKNVTKSKNKIDYLEKVKPIEISSPIKLETLVEPSTPNSLDSISSRSLTNGLLKSNESSSFSSSSPIKPLRSLSDSLYGKNLTSVAQLSKDQLNKLFNLAHDLRNLVTLDKDLTHILRGKVLSIIFLQPSTKSQCSFTAAVHKLGGNVNVVDYAESKNESLEDSLRVISRYSDCIVFRHTETGAADFASKYSLVPLINGGDGIGEDPTQALVDIFTIYEELGTLDGITITMCGDLKNGRSAHSIAKLLPLFGNIKLRYITPETLKMPEDIRNSLRNSSVIQEECRSLEEAIVDTDVLHITRINKENFENPIDYDRTIDKFIVTPQLLRRAKRKMIVTHSLPRGIEVNPALDSGMMCIFF